MPTDATKAAFTLLALRMAKDVLPWFNWKFFEETDRAGSLADAIIGDHPDLYGGEIILVVSFQGEKASPASIIAKMVAARGEALPWLKRGPQENAPLLDVLLAARRAWSDFITSASILDAQTVKHISTVINRYQGDSAEFEVEAELVEDTTTKAAWEDAARGVASTFIEALVGGESLTIDDVVATAKVRFPGMAGILDIALAAAKAPRAPKKDP